MANTQINEQLLTIEKFNSEQQLEEYLVSDALEKYSNLFGKPFYPYYFRSTTDIAFDSATAETVVGASNLQGDFSQTNTQESGVDEADLVETDGSYIYQVIGQDLTVVDARNPEQLSIVSQTDLKELGNIQGAYLYEDKLTVISTTSPWQFWSNSFFYYDPISFNPTVNVSVFDVSNPNSVVLEEKSELDGYLLSSRAVGDEVYVVTQAAFGLPQPQLKPQRTFTKSTVYDSSRVVSTDLAPILSIDLAPIQIYPISSQRYETQKEYLARLEGRVLEEGLSNFTTVDGQGNILRSGLLNSAENIYKPLEDNPVQLTSVSLFDVDDNLAGPQLSTGIPTSGAREIYTSLENLYLLEPELDATSTDILKVNLDTIELVAVGEAPGRVLNQFSVDEENGFLRVATTTGFGNNSKNNVYVLEQEGQQLNIVGSVEGIAPGERIYSARFQDDYGFVVTFREVDPFFTLDLSTPTNPTVVGELKLPGFSEYLQVINNGDTTQVLGIGRESNDLKVSLFEVTDLKNPQEVDSFIFEGQYSSSEAQWDQQAVSYFPESQTLAIPFQINGKNGLRVFDVDPENGLTSRGDILHEGGRIQRSLRIGEELYVISNERVTVHDLFTLGQKSEVILPNSSNEYPILPIDPIIIRPVDVFNLAATSDVSLIAV
jgi:inhibitor of cysteine peptidase